MRNISRLTTSAGTAAAELPRHARKEQVSTSAVQEEVLALYDAAAPGLRRYVRSCVCANQVAQAQREIASDWVAAYKQYFKTDVPLQAHVGAPLADEDELEFAPMALNIR